MGEGHHQQTACYMQRVTGQHVDTLKTSFYGAKATNNVKSGNILLGHPSWLPLFIFVGPSSRVHSFVGPPYIEGITLASQYVHG